MIKVVQLFLAMLIVGLVGCGGGSGSPTKVESDADRQSRPGTVNGGLAGTLYFTSGNRFSSLDLQNPEVSILYDGVLIHGLSSTADGALHALETNGPEIEFGRIAVLNAVGQLISEFLFPNFPMSDPQISPDGGYVAILLEPRNDSASDGIYIYDSSGQLVRKILDSPSEGRIASSIGWTSDGALAVSYAQTGIFIVNDVRTSEPQLVLETPDFTMLKISFGPLTDRLAYKSSVDGQLYVFDQSTGKSRQLTRPSGLFQGDSAEKISGFDWSPDELHLVANIDSYLANACTGRVVVIVGVNAEAERLPDTIERNYTSPNIFIVKQSVDRTLIDISCARDGISWAP